MPARMFSGGDVLSKPSSDLPEPARRANQFHTWSPDGRWIYFVHGIVDTEEWDLRRVPAAGGQAERLTEFNRYLGFPTPLDSRTVVYVGKDQDGSGPWLWTP